MGMCKKTYLFISACYLRGTWTRWQRCKACAVSVLLQGKLSLIYNSHKHFLSLTIQTLIGVYWRLFQFIRVRKGKQDPGNQDLGLRICTGPFFPLPLNIFTGKTWKQKMKPRRLTHRFQEGSTSLWWNKALTVWSNRRFYLFHPPQTHWQVIGLQLQVTSLQLKSPM